MGGGTRPWEWAPWLAAAWEREAHLRALATFLGLAERVRRWVGPRRDLRGLYSALAMAAHTSHDEGTPVATSSSASWSGARWGSLRGNLDTGGDDAAPGVPR